MKGPRSFTRDASRETGFFPWCKTCVLDYRKAHHFQPEDGRQLDRLCPVCDTPLRGNTNRQYCSTTCKGKAKGWRDKYNLTVEQYRRLVPADGRCPICRQRPTLWNVDHNHRTGEVMGLVCTKCNVGALATTFHNEEFILRLLDFIKNPPAVAAGIIATVNEERIGKSNVHEVWRGGVYTPRPAEKHDDDLPF